MMTRPASTSPVTSRLVILVFAVTVTGSSLAALDIPVLRHARSAHLTAGVPDVAPGRQGEPKVRATPRGYCATWFDTRQGGMVMAARIAKDGTLRDPLGIPVMPVPNASTWHPWTIDVIANDLRCVVLHPGHGGVAGRLITFDGDPDPVTIPIVEVAGPFEIAAVDGERAVVAESFGGGVQLTLVDVAGTVLWSHAVEEPHFVTRVALSGSTAWVFVQSPSRTGFLGLWKVGADGAQRFATGVQSSEIFHWGAVVDGETLVVVDLDPAGSPDLVRIARTDMQGQLLETRTVTGLPGNVRLQQLWQEGDAVYALLGSTEGAYLLTIRRSESVAAISLPGVKGAAMAGQADGLSLWHGADERLVYALGHPGQPGGAPITRALRAEVVADAATFDEGIAVLWVEIPTSGDEQILRLGFVDPGSLTLVRESVVAEGQIVGGLQDDAAVVRAAIERVGDIFVVAWIEGTTLKVRRIGVNGAWIGEPLVLDGLAATLHPDGLVPHAGQLLLVWTVHAGTPIERETRAAFIGPLGSLVRRDPPRSEEMAGARGVSSAIVDDGVVVAVRHPGPGGCVITCDPRDEISFLFLNEAGAWAAVSHDVESFYASRVSTVVGHGQQVTVLRGERWLTTLRRTGTMLTEVETLVLEGNASGLFWSGRVHVLSRRSDASASSHTRLSRVRNGVVETLITIPDSGSLPSFIPGLLAFGDRLFVIGSEVSLERDEGGVRRIRVHELIPEVVRRRGVRR